MTEKNLSDTIFVAATFTVDPIVEVLDYYASMFSWPVHVALGPYAQLHQLLTIPASEYHRAAGADRNLFIRWSDIVDASGSADAYDKAAQDLADHIFNFSDKGPVAVYLCPQRIEREFALRANNLFLEHAAKSGHVVVFACETAFELYDVNSPFDARADHTAHVPYTMEAFAAMGSAVARRHFSKRTPPRKLFAVDGDNTLWRGVLGEAGVDGVEADQGAMALQKELKRQVQSGRMVSIVSKNRECDVEALFDHREDFPLCLSDTMKNKINWRPKSENIQALAGEFNIGADAIVFIDDNPLEIAEVRSACPGTTSVQIPEGAAEKLAFVNNFWPFDIAKTTSEDQRRAQMYRDDAKRGGAEKCAASYAKFIEELELSIEFFPVDESTITRASQLTKRTNQFNINLNRMDERELRLGLRNPHSYLTGVRVADRFGDYGFVGLIGSTRESGRITVDFFMLSCRALGRGVEHKMLAHIANGALESGARKIEFSYADGPRNEPAKKFLQEAAQSSIEGSGVVVIPIERATSFKFEPAEAKPPVDASSAPTHSAKKSARTGFIDSDSASIEFVATRLTTAQDVLRAINANFRKRPDLTTPFVSPATGLETQIADIWERILNVSPIGANDAFHDLGGKSIHLVRIHAALADELGVEMDLVALFESGTLKQLADRALALVGGSKTPGANDRAAKMRKARRRAGMRDAATKRRRA
ncbi:MAG: HAD-IIIC family phosphatase [Marinicaulis sp.]|nr:HAD-IIIC family phosphatase [Marinicaulis sp.]